MWQMSVFDHWHKNFSFETLRHRLWAMPMPLIIIPFIVGIILANNFDTPIEVVCGAIIVAMIGALYSRPHNVAYMFVTLLVMLFGVLVVMLGRLSVSTPYNCVVEMKVDIVSPIVEREDYSVAEGRIKEWQGDVEWHEANDRVQLWLRSDTLRYGDRVHIVGELRERISRYKDYNTLMHNRGYVGGIGISDFQIIDIERDIAGGVRRYAIEKLGRYAKDTASHSVVEGMVAGARYTMPSGLRQAYSTTGLSHILAVSGLHLGIILLVINLLLKPLKLLTQGHILADILAVGALWLFVVMSGASPSVVRAALMLSVLMFVRNSTGHYNPINALAFTILLMLCYNPQTLYDISFQLSVLAVTGIVAWGAPMVRAIRFRRKFIGVVLSTLVIGIVATLWTLPIVSMTFGNIPIVGVVATPLVLITAYAIVSCGVIVLLLPHPIAQPFALLAEWLSSIQNVVVEWFSALPFASIQYAFTPTMIAIYYTLFGVITLALWSHKPTNKRQMLTLSQLEK